MKIEIGPTGKILGTKRVSNNGQVSGFTEYAGREVLVILPGDDTPVVHRDARDLVSEAEHLVQQQMHLAFRANGALKTLFKTPERAAERFLQTVNPSMVTGLLERADQWVKDQAKAAGGKVQRTLSRGRNASE